MVKYGIRPPEDGASSPTNEEIAPEPIATPSYVLQNSSDVQTEEPGSASIATSPSEDQGRPVRTVVVVVPVAIAVLLLGATAFFFKTSVARALWGGEAGSTDTADPLTAETRENAFSNLVGHSEAVAHRQNTASHEETVGVDLTKVREGSFSGGGGNAMPPPARRGDRTVDSQDTVMLDSTVVDTAKQTCIVRGEPPSIVPNRCSPKEAHMKFIHQLLDSFGPQYLLMDKYLLLGRKERRNGSVLLLLPCISVVLFCVAVDVNYYVGFDYKFC